MADRSAAGGEYGEALAWLETLDAIGVRPPREYATKRAVWSRASTVRSELNATRKRLLLNEPRATQRMLALCRDLEASSDSSGLLDRALDGAMRLLSTDMGNVQIAEPTTGALTIAVSSGFDSEFLEYFAIVDDENSACGRAARQRAQTVIADVTEDPRFAPHREIAAAAGFMAVQSTPILDPGGRLWGVLSTHFADRRRPTPLQLQLLDWYGERIGAALAMA